MENTGGISFLTNYLISVLHALSKLVKFCHWEAIHISDERRRLGSLGSHFCKPMFCIF